MPSPSGNMQVTISATLKILGQTITVNTGEGNFIFQLSQPVTLGTLKDFVQKFLHDQLGLPITEKDVDDLEALIPIKALKDAFETLFNSPITLTVLYINYGAGQYAFGVSTALTPPISILGLLEFDGIGINVANTEPPTGSP
jgi:hypothetical protein